MSRFADLMINHAMTKEVVSVLDSFLGFYIRWSEKYGHNETFT